MIWVRFAIAFIGLIIVILMMVYNRCPSYAPLGASMPSEFHAGEKAE